MILLRSIILLIASMLIFSFKGNPIKEELLIGKWQCVSFETPTEDSTTVAQYVSQLQQINEWRAVPKVLEEEMGIENLDSAKAFAINFLEEQFQQKEPERQKFIESFQLLILENGNAYRTIVSNTDTAKWYAFNTKSGITLLILDPFGEDKINVPLQSTLAGFEIEYADSDSLRLKIRQPKEIITTLSFKKIK